MRRRVPHGPTLLLLAACALAPGREPMAAEATLRAPVRAVELAPDGALVTRALRLDLEAGRHTLVIGGLPGMLDAAGLALEVRPADTLRIVARRLLVRHLAEPVSRRERELLARLRELEAEHRRQKDRARAAEAQLRLLERIGEVGADIATRGLLEGRFDPEAWRRAWETVGTGTVEVLELQRQAEEEAARLEDGIAALRAELERVRGGGTSVAELVLDVEATRAGAVDVRIVHPDGRAGFEPLLVAALDGTAGRLTVEQRALVRQRTGEDWEDIDLTLAGIAAPGEVAPPEPEPWWVDLREPPPPVPRKPEASEGLERIPGALPLSALLGERGRTAFHARWHLPLPVDVPADGGEVDLLLERTDLDAQLVLETVPAEREAAFVVAKATWRDTVPLPAATVRLVRDGIPVGEAEIAAVPPGGELRLGFGVDPAVRVSRIPLEQTRGGSGWLRTRGRLVRRWLVRVGNGHDRPVRVVVHERLPVPRDERLKVEPADDATPPDARDVRGVPGLLAWNLDLAPGEAREIRFGFVLSWPEDLVPVGPDLWEE